MPARTSYPLPAHQGFTLVEMVITVAVLAILIAIATPSFRDILESQRMRAAAFDLMADLTLARNEALKRGAIAAPVTLTSASASTDWASGWSMTVGTEVLSQRNRVGSGVTLTGPAALTFDRNGRVSSSTNVVRFALTNTSGSRKRCVSIDPSGRPKSAATECPA